MERLKKIWVEFEIAVLSPDERRQILGRLESLPCAKPANHVGVDDVDLLASTLLKEGDGLFFVRGIYLGVKSGEGLTKFLAEKLGIEERNILAMTGMPQSRPQLDKSYNF